MNVINNDEMINKINEMFDANVSLSNIDNNENSSKQEEIDNLEALKEYLEESFPIIEEEPVKER